MVPETQMVTFNDTVCVPERRTQVVNYTACRLAYETVNRQITVDVPHTETRQGTRTVCTPVATQEMQTVCRDVGQWETRSFTDCCGCTHSCQVWAAKVVTEHARDGL